jgi:DNA-binding LytR/AlgR family response regulator
MSVLIITDQEQNKMLLDSRLLEEGIINFHSLSIKENLSPWLSRLNVSLLILMLENTSIEKIKKIIESARLNTQVILPFKFDLPQYSNLIYLEGTEKIDLIAQYIHKYKFHKEASKEDILIRINDKYKRIRTADIEYLQADGKYITLNLGDREFSIRSSLKAMQMILPENFIRTHAAYIANAEKIESIHIHEQNIELTSGNIPFSRRYKSEILDRFFLG